ncbi:hypothetical protein [Paenibacillus sp. NPDC058071]|uniref:hypothetical protein n=1 Tax=Paenibacillus sp. NPDC058071 TaxID=3346326 RepID=UPI0036DF7970
MKRYSFSRAALTAVLFCLFLSGCRYTAAPADLLTKPTLSGEKQALMQAVNNVLPMYAKLTLPLRDDGLGSVRLVDLNGDGIDEAIVSFYNEYSTPELLTLRFTSGMWRPWLSIQQPMARQIDWIRLVDFDRNGQVELAIGWIGSFESPSLAEVYSFQSKPSRNDDGKLALQPLASIPYIYAETGDINGDGNTELAVITADGLNQEYQLPSYRLTVYGWQDTSMKLQQEVPLYDGVNTYERMVIGRVSDRHHGVIVEASTGAHATYTALYAWENGKLKLVRPQAEAQGPDEDGSIEGRPVQSEDINGDGIIELMKARQAPGYGYDEFSYVDQLWLNDWVQWDGKKGFMPIRLEYSDYDYRISLTIPEKWQNRFTLRKPDQSDEYGIAAFEYWNEETDYKAKLGVLYAVPSQKWNEAEANYKDKGRSYVLLGAGGGVLYVFSYAEPSTGIGGADLLALQDMKLTDQELISLFSQLED